MPVTLVWQQIAIRLALTFVAGWAIGFNRGEHGRAAGMRTNLLVCLAASVAMIQANLLMDTVGKAKDSFVVLDLMRLPLGILCGMGFIGAGAILRKDNLVIGVTSAATLWFTTVMGLCFGGGQIGLGIAALFLGLVTLWGLKHIEKRMFQDLRATLTLIIRDDSMTDDQIREKIVGGDCTPLAWGVTYLDSQRRQVQAEVQHRALHTDTMPPRFVAELAQTKHVESVRWWPQGLSNGRELPPQPEGTPIPISAAK